jgi:hypothetical protein
MKRSEKYLRSARRSGAVCLLSVAMVGLGCVVAASAMPCLPFVVFGGAFVALAALCGAVASLMDCILYLRLSGREAQWEWQREVRPRI